MPDSYEADGTMDPHSLHTSVPHCHSGFGTGGLELLSMNINKHNSLPNMGIIFLQEAVLEKIMLRKINNFSIKYCCKSPSHATAAQPALCYVTLSQGSFKVSTSQPLPPLTQLV
jgi:hypothetical protein